MIIPYFREQQQTNWRLKAKDAVSINASIHRAVGGGGADLCFNSFVSEAASTTPN
jgi:hypothetical protein